MKDHEIDELLNGAKSPQVHTPETLGRIASSIGESMDPVRPLPPQWMLAGGVVLICMAVALTGAAVFGFSGIARMNVLDRIAVFSALVILVLAAANELVCSFIPGSRRRFSSGSLLMVAGSCLAVVLASCFRDYQTTNFLHAGLVCIAIGLLHAIPAGLLSLLALRRGFAVNAVSTGLIAGTMAGLAGVGMLELHCPNFQTDHLLVWHVGVLLVSAGLGAFCGRLWIRSNNPAPSGNWSRMN